MICSIILALPSFYGEGLSRQGLQALSNLSHLKFWKLLPEDLSSVDQQGLIESYKKTHYPHHTDRQWTMMCFRLAQCQWVRQEDLLGEGSKDPHFSGDTRNSAQKLLLNPPQVVSVSHSWWLILLPKMVNTRDLGLFL